MRRGLLLWGVPALAALAGLLVWALGGRDVETDNAYLKADLVTLHPEIDAQVTEVLVEENQVVTAGQALVRLDRAAAAIDVARAEAHLSSVRGELDALRRQYAQRQGERRLAEEQLAYTRKESARQRELVDRKLAPAMRLDAAEHEALQAQGRLGVVDDGIAELRVRLGAALAGDAAAHPRVREAMAELDAARLRLEHAELRAPSAGRVVKVPERGSMARRGAAVMTLVRSEDLWVEANFKETQLGMLRVGQKARVRLDSYPDAEWRGRIDTISPASGAEFAVLPPQNASGNWVKVVQRVPVRIALEDGPALTLRAGTSATVTVDVESGNRWDRLVGRR
jgi:membrane fusion protein (multidrug efflux system)